MFLADDKDMLTDPLPQLLGELVTARQLGIIRRLSASAGVCPDAECGLYFGCATDALSRRAASALIEHLSRLAESQRQTAI